MRFVAGFTAGLAGYLRDRLLYCLVVAATLVAGVVAGAIVASGLTSPERAGVSGSLFGFLGDLALNQRLPSAAELLRHSVGQHLRTAALLWLLGVTVVGFPGVLVILFVRGFSIGFTVGFLVHNLGLAGLAVAAAGVLPQHLLAVPVVLVQGVAAVSFSVSLFRNRFGREHRGRFYQELAGYTVLIAGTSLVLVGAALLESFISPLFLRLAAHLVE